jgi:aspartate aminotransferase-like enzyme
MPEILFKQAETAEEIEQIHRFNHQVFAEEIGQHPATSDGRLIDPFHHRNHYFIAVEQGVLTGMVSVHDGHEFSVAKRLKDPSILKTLRAPLEVRLLAIRPQARNRAVLAGLLWQVLDYARRYHYSDLLISGIVERVPMYAKIGFLPMGPPVPEGTAAFVPMRVCLDSASTPLHRKSGLYARRWQRSHAISLLPGPVAISEAVQEAFRKSPISHRSQSFLTLYEECRSLLSELMPGMATAILCGTGTLANDAVAANLRAAFGASKGLVLSNGEFGERLLRQASFAGLKFKKLQFPWGRAWEFAAIEHALEEMPAWIWAVHLETSTGVLNDLPRLIRLAQEHGIRIAADCVSSLGAVDMNILKPGLNDTLFLATGVSGKALAAYAGLSFAFLSEEALHQLSGKELCPSFDLPAAAQTTGPLFTISSPLLFALVEALRQNYSSDARRLARYTHYHSLGQWTRRQIRDNGLTPLAQDEIAAPTITTFPLPSPAFPRQCLQAGYKISHESEYLARHRWGQIATMGNLDQAQLEPLFEYFRSRETRDRGAYSPAFVSAAM